MIFVTKQGITIKLSNPKFKASEMNGNDGLEGLVMIFKNLLICRSIAFGSPQGEIEFDIIGTREDINYFFYDGLELTLSIFNPLNQASFNSNIIIFGTPKLESFNSGSEDVESTTIKVSFIFKSTKEFLTGLTKNIYKGTFKNIIQTIAEETQQSKIATKSYTNIKDTTELKIFSYGKTYIQLLKNLIDYFYPNTTENSETITFFYDMDDTLSVVGLNNKLTETPTKTLKARQINLSLPDTTIQKEMIKSNVYYIDSVRSKSYSGLLNNIAGNKSITKKDSLFRGAQTDETGKTTETNIIETTETTFNSSYGENTYEMPSTQKESLIFYDSFTTDPESRTNYSYFNNLRKKCLWSNEISCLIEGNKSSQIKLLEVVNLDISAGIKSFYNGKYIVTGKSMKITSESYKEKIVLLNYGKKYKNLANTI